MRNIVSLVDYRVEPIPSPLQSLADLLPPLYDYAPTLRIAYFEVEPWIWERGAVRSLRELVEPRL